MEWHATWTTAPDTKESAAADIRSKPQSLPRHASGSSEHRDLADDQVVVADTATSARADNVQTPSTTTPDGCQDTATESALAVDPSQSQAGVPNSSNDEDLPLLPRTEESEYDTTIRSTRETYGDNKSVRYTVDIGHAVNNRIHFGDQYNIYNAGDKSHTVTQKLGIEFSLSIHDNRTHGLSSGDVSTFKKRTMYVSKKQQPFRAHMDHLGVYTSYAKVGRSSLRSMLLRIARLFLRLDRLFAAMFVHIAQEYDHNDLRDLLSQIRCEITRKQPHDSNANSDRDVNFLGDLGHHCEALLRQKSQSEKIAERDEKFQPNPAPPVPDEIDHESQFEVSHGTEESLLRYLQDSLEIPYWKIMLDAFSAFRANKTTLGTDMVSLSLKSLRFKARLIRHEVQRIIDESQGSETGMDGILCGVDKRIDILSSFADGIISNSDEDDELFEQMLLIPIGALERRKLKLLETAATVNNVDEDRHEQPSSPADLLVLVPLVLLTLMLAIVPFVLGYTRSNEKGIVQDSDFWYNISSNIFTIMTNLVMIIQLTHGSRSSKNHLFTWMWFALGILCAIASVAIYPFCNTGWSSLLSFFATIAGFGATLSVAMTVSNPRSDEPLAKKKVD